MLLVVSGFVTFDGVMQAPGGPDEDRDGGFEHGGWSFPFFDEEMGRTIDAGFAATTGLLLGRKTYEIFAAHWPRVSEEHEDGSLAVILNRLPKYVVSTTLQNPEWANTTVISNVTKEVPGLKESGDGELTVQGSSNLIQTLHREGLVDEYRLWIAPVALGSGKRLFENGAVPTGFELAESRVNSKGAIYVVYRPTGAPDTGSFTLPDQE